ncbi:hypothetical protein ELS07_24685 [Salmonella enterica subsp. enterica serovar Lomalinda]|nr:hypothetical protein [Salmonella enterica subsp. enterica serovar Lomalinda]ECI5320785.1 hypothetical protein [Salmonella enterica subsp. enterica serovar Lomalinda]
MLFIQLICLYHAVLTQAMWVHHRIFHDIIAYFKSLLEIAFKIMIDLKINPLSILMPFCSY